MLQTTQSWWKCAPALIAIVLSVCQSHGSDPLFPSPVEWPTAGSSDVRPLTNEWLELRFVQEQKSWDKSASPALPETWSTQDWEVRVGGQPVNLKDVGWRRRPILAEYHEFDLRILTQVFLRVSQVFPPGVPIEVISRDSKMRTWAAKWETDWTPDSITPTLHYSHFGYAPHSPKFAYWSYDLGDLGELKLKPETPAILVTADGTEVFRGIWEKQIEEGWKWHQEVWRFDFSALEKSGEYWLEVPDVGRTGPLRVFPEAAAVAPRLLASAFYHQRSGAKKSEPFTRHGHKPSHVDPAWVPSPNDNPMFTPTLRHLAAMAKKNTREDQIAPTMLTPEDSLFPFQRKGRIDVSGGHYDAGDYSKYTINSAQVIHNLVLAVDHFPGAAQQDFLGLPESGDHVSDALQIALWEAEFLLKMQDDDGGFYFLVYPRDRPYELDVLPENGDPQVVFPKNTAATAAATGALAQLAASPVLKQIDPDFAQRCLDAARKGFDFLQKAHKKFGDAGSYQTISHYGDFAGHQDEWAFAAAALWIATGEAKFADELRRVWPDPEAGSDMRWSWWPLFESFGSAARVLALGVPPSDAKPPLGWDDYVTKVRQKLRSAADVWLNLSNRNAFGLPLSLSGKRQGRAGWFWAMDPAIDLITATLLNPSDSDLHNAVHRAVAAWAAYESGANPLDQVFYTGSGPVWRRQAVNRMSLNDDRKLAVPGIPIGNVTSTPHHLRPYALDGRAGLRQTFFPALDRFAFYDRSGTDAYNSREEWTISTGARLLAAHLYLLGDVFPDGMTPPKHPDEIKISMTPEVPSAGERVTLHVTGPNGQALDKSMQPLVVWEWISREPITGSVWETMASDPGDQRVEVEVLWPDGFRRAARHSFEVLPSEPQTD